MSEQLSADQRGDDVLVAAPRLDDVFDDALVDARPWFAALRAHTLMFQQCTDCGTWRFPPRSICNRCTSFESTWEAATPLGTVSSFIIQTDPDDPDDPDEASSAISTTSAERIVVLVRSFVQEDVLVPGSWGGDTRPTIGALVEATFTQAVDHDEPRLVWVPVPVEDPPDAEVERPR